MRMLPSTPYRTGSRAELKVFDRLRATFADRADWHLTALHSLNLPSHAYKRFGEIDFVLVGRPGLFVLEVKGGASPATRGSGRPSTARVNGKPCARALSVRPNRPCTPWSSDWSVTWAPPSSTASPSATASSFPTATGT